MKINSNLAQTRLGNKQVDTRYSGTHVGPLYPETIVIPTGASVLISPIPGQLVSHVRYGTGGSLSITNISDAAGSSLSAGVAYLFQDNEILSLNMVSSFYLSATGATVTAYLLRGRSPGTGNP